MQRIPTHPTPQKQSQASKLPVTHMHPLQIQGRDITWKYKFQQAWSRGSTLGNWDGAGLTALHQQVPHRRLRHGGLKPSPTTRAV